MSNGFRPTPGAGLFAPAPSGAVAPHAGEAA